MIDWKDMYFYPINLWTVIPAYQLVDTKIDWLYNNNVILTKEGVK